MGLIEPKGMDSLCLQYFYCSRTIYSHMPLVQLWLLHCTYICSMSVHTGKWKFPLHFLRHWIRCRGMPGIKLSEWYVYLIFMKYCIHVLVTIPCYEWPLFTVFNSLKNSFSLYVSLLPSWCATIYICLKKAQQMTKPVNYFTLLRKE